MNHANRQLRLAALTLAFAAAVSAVSASERTRVISASKLPEAWMPAPGAAAPVPAYPSVVADKSQTACVTVGFLIRLDGSTADHALLKAWSGKQGDEVPAEFIDPYARNAIAAVQQWRFVPAKNKPRQAYTTASFGFSADPAADQGSLRAHCEIDNLTAFIAKAQAEAYRRGDLKKGELDRGRSRPQIVPAPGTGVY